MKDFTQRRSNGYQKCLVQVPMKTQQSSIIVAVMQFLIFSKYLIIFNPHTHYLFRNTKVGKIGYEPRFINVKPEIQVPGPGTYNHAGNISQV